MPRKALALALAMSSVVVGCGTSASDGFPLHDVDEVRLPGPAVRFDYQDFDPAARRLMISHLAADEVLFVDVGRLDEISVVGDLPGVHGVRLAPDLGLAFASTSNNELATIDVESARVVHRSTTGSFPDGVAYDQASGLVVVSNKDDGSVTVIAADTGDVVRTVAVGDEAGNSIDDPTTGHVFVASAGPSRWSSLTPSPGTVRSRSSRVSATPPWSPSICEPATRSTTSRSAVCPTCLPTTPACSASMWPQSPETSPCSNSSTAGCARSDAGDSTRTLIASPSTPRPTACSCRCKTWTAIRCCGSWSPDPPRRAASRQTGIYGQAITAAPSRRSAGAVADGCGLRRNARRLPPRSATCRWAGSRGCRRRPRRSCGRTRRPWP